MPTTCSSHLLMKNTHADLWLSVQRPTHGITSNCRGLFELRRHLKGVKYSKSYMWWVVGQGPITFEMSLVSKLEVAIMSLNISNPYWLAAVTAMCIHTALQMVQDILPPTWKRHNPVEHFRTKGPHCWQRRDAKFSHLRHAWARGTVASSVTTFTSYFLPPSSRCYTL